MKDSKVYAKKIANLYRDMKKEHGKVKTVEYEDPIEAIVFGILCEHLSLPASRSAMRKFNKHFVDLNDLRVSRNEEIIEVFGKKDEETKVVANELSESLNAIFYQFDTISLVPLKEEGKRQAKKELEELEKISQFVISYCFLTALDGHAIPVSESMADYLRVEELVHPKSKTRDIEGFLERQIKADDAYEFFMLLKTHSDAAAKKTSKKLAKADEEAKSEDKPAENANSQGDEKESKSSEKAADKKTTKKKTKKTAKKSTKTTKKFPKKKEKKTTAAGKSEKQPSKTSRTTKKTAVKKTVKKKTKKASKKAK